jgi:hypothetical protein
LRVIREHKRNPPEVNAAKLYSPGTKMAEIKDPFLPGLKLRDWMDLVFDRLRAEAQPIFALWAKEASEKPQRISSSRDNYGWRSLPGGTRYLGQ